MRYRGGFRVTTIVLVVVAWAMGACSGDGGPSRVADPVRTDSAGIEVVLTTIGAAAAPVFATPDRVPSLRLGSWDGAPEELFGVVRGVQPLPDGSVAILDGQAAEIRLFDGDGAYLMSLGGKGTGPGEFQSPINLALLAGDTLTVYDADLRRITRFGPDGSLGRVTTLKDTQARIVVAAFLSDGRLAGQSRWLAPGGGPLPGPELTFARDTAVLTLFAPDGDVIDTLDVIPGRETLTSIERTQGSISVFRRTAAFGRTNVFAGHPDGIWSSANDRFELRLRDAETGRLLRIVRAPGLERSVTEELAQAVYDRAISEVQTADERRRSEAWFARSPRPNVQPAYDHLVVDDQARLWVREWSAPDPGNRWWVFSAAGDLLGSVDFPNSTSVVAVRCAWAWGIEEDELGVSYVVRYALEGVADC